MTALGGGRPRIVVATRSDHKLRELRQLLHPAWAELVSLDDIGIADEVDETGETFEANARLKARTYARLSGLPALADDSGLEVDALDGGPGVRTKRFSGENATDESNNRKLLSAMLGLPPHGRGARYVCVLALAMPVASGVPVVRMSRGTLRGSGVEVWHPRFSYYGFRYVQAQVTAAGGRPKPAILKVTGKFTHADVQMVGRFETSDVLFGKIHHLIDMAVLSNLASVLTDCPHREKLGWLEQTYLAGPSIFSKMTPSLSTKKWRRTFEIRNSTTEWFRESRRNMWRS